jgi:outer membrane biosynthesis protein TonB
MRHPLSILALALLHTVPLAAQAAGNDSYVIPARELSLPPRLLQANARYYPAQQRSRAATVSVQFVIDTAGAPDARSIKVIRSPDSTFAEAARLTIAAQEYKPGYLRGLPVRTLMDYQVSFKPGSVSCDQTTTSRMIVFCVDSAGPP